MRGVNFFPADLRNYSLVPFDLERPIWQCDTCGEGRISTDSAMSPYQRVSVPKISGTPSMPISFDLEEANLVR